MFGAARPARAPYASRPRSAFFIICLGKIRLFRRGPGLCYIMDRVGSLLDLAIVAETPKAPAKVLDLSQLNIEALRKRFLKANRHTEVERLKNTVSSILGRMIRQNRSRMDYLARLQAMIDEYNAGSLNVEEFFSQLLKLTEELQEEDRRGIRENLTDEELAVFDLLTRPQVKLTQKETLQVKKVAKQLLETLKAEKLVLDWRKKQQSRAAVRVCIEAILEGLPPVYGRQLFQTKCDAIYQHVYDSYLGSGQSVYATA